MTFSCKMEPQETVEPKIMSKNVCTGGTQRPGEGNGQTMFQVGTIFRLKETGRGRERREKAGNKVGMGKA